MSATCLRWFVEGDKLKCRDGTVLPLISDVSGFKDDEREWPKMSQWLICTYLMRTIDIDGKPMDNHKSLDSYQLFHSKKVEAILHHKITDDLVYLKAKVRDI